MVVKIQTLTIQFFVLGISLERFTDVGSGQLLAFLFLKPNFIEYPAIHTNYSLSNCNHLKLDRFKSI